MFFALALDSIHHCQIGIVFELEQIVGWILQEEGSVFFRTALESHERPAEELYIVFDSNRQHLLELVLISESDPEMPRIHLRMLVDLVGAQMTHDLVA
jgi:hypothetical protein